MPNKKAPPGGHHPPQHHKLSGAHHSSTHNLSDMDKVKIKRVKRNKKETTTKEKILAGLGVGGSLLGGIAGVNAGKGEQKTQFVRVNDTQKSSQSGQSKIKGLLNKVFGISEARAAGMTPPAQTGSTDGEVFNDGTNVWTWDAASSSWSWQGQTGSAQANFLLGQQADAPANDPTAQLLQRANDDKLGLSQNQQNHQMPASGGDASGGNQDFNQNSLSGSGDTGTGGRTNDLLSQQQSQPVAGDSSYYDQLRTGHTSQNLNPKVQVPPSTPATPPSVTDSGDGSGTNSGDTGTGASRGQADGGSTLTTRPNNFDPSQGPGVERDKVSGQLSGTPSLWIDSSGNVTGTDISNVHVVDSLGRNIGLDGYISVDPVQIDANNSHLAHVTVYAHDADGNVIASQTYDLNVNARAVGGNDGQLPGPGDKGGNTTGDQTGGRAGNDTGRSNDFTPGNLDPERIKGTGPVLTGAPTLNDFGNGISIADVHSTGGDDRISIDDHNVDYKTPGTYTVTLNAYDVNGNLTSQDYQIIIPVKRLVDNILPGPGKRKNGNNIEITSTTLTPASALYTTYSSDLDSQITQDLSDQISAQIASGQVGAIRGDSVVAFMLGWGGANPSDTRTVGSQTYKFDGNNWLLQKAPAATTLTAQSALSTDYDPSLDSQITSDLSSQISALIASGQVGAIRGTSVAAYMLSLGGAKANDTTTIGSKTYKFDGNNWLLQTARTGGTAVTLQNINQAINFDPTDPATLQQIKDLQSQVMANLTQYTTVTPGSPLAYMLGLGDGSGLTSGSAVTASDGKTPYVYSTDANGNSVFRLGVPKGYTQITIDNINSVQYDGSVLTNTYIESLRSQMTPAQFAALQAQGVQPGSVLAYMLGLGSDTNVTSIKGTDGNTYKLVDGVWKLVSSTTDPGTAKEGDTKYENNIQLVYHNGQWTTIRGPMDPGYSGPLLDTTIKQNSDGTYTVSLTVNGKNVSYTGSWDKINSDLEKDYGTRYANDAQVFTSVIAAIDHYKSNPGGTGTSGNGAIFTGSGVTDNQLFTPPAFSDYLDTWLKAHVPANMPADQVAALKVLILQARDGNIPVGVKITPAQGDAIRNSQNDYLTYTQQVQADQQYMVAYNNWLEGGQQGKAPTAPAGFSDRHNTDGSLKIGPSSSFGAATVTYSGGQNPNVGDEWQIIVTGTPGQPVYSKVGSSVSLMGYIDGTGKLLLKGTFTADMLTGGDGKGNWTENWFVGSDPRTNTSATAAGTVSFNLSNQVVKAATVAAPTKNGYSATVTPNQGGGFTVTLSNGLKFTAASQEDLNAQMQRYSTSNADDQKVFAALAAVMNQLNNPGTTSFTPITNSLGDGKTLTMTTLSGSSTIGVGDAPLITIQAGKANANAPVYAVGGIDGTSGGTTFLGYTDANGNLTVTTNPFGGDQTGNWHIKIVIGQSGAKESASPLGIVNIDTSKMTQIGSTLAFAVNAQSGQFAPGFVAQANLISTITDPSGVSYKNPLNPQYFATQATAEYLAQRYGGVAKLVPSDFTKMAKIPNATTVIPTDAQNWWVIEFPDGTQINAGQLAKYFAGMPDNVADMNVKQAITDAQRLKTSGPTGVTNYATNTFNPAVYGTTAVGNRAATGGTTQGSFAGLTLDALQQGNNGSNGGATAGLTLDQLGGGNTGGSSSSGGSSGGSGTTGGSTSGGGGGSIVAGVTPFFTTLSQLPSAYAGQSYVVGIQATSNYAMTYSIISGSLPSGLSMSGNGTISGVPNALGTYTFTVQAITSQGVSAIQQFTLSVVAPGSGGGFTGGQVQGAYVFQGLQMPGSFVNDISNNYANVNGTIYDKNTGHAFASPQEFFAASGLNSFDGLIFDTSWSPSGGGAVAGASTTQVAGTYTVKKGDTLWSIAQKQYGDGRKWRKILSANTDQVKNPKTLKVGTVLVIPKL